MDEIIAAALRDECGTLCEEEKEAQKPLRVVREGAIALAFVAGFNMLARKATCCGEKDAVIAAGFAA